jgi:HEAT repeat protein
MESSLKDRFRLIYLKSEGVSEKSFLDDSNGASNAGGSEESAAVSSYRETPESFSFQVKLRQIELDLKDPSPTVRNLAVRSLEKLDNPAAALPLLRQALSDQDPDVRARALRALIKLKNTDETLLLKKHLKDSSPKVRMIALQRILQGGQQVDLNTCLQLLSEKSPTVRRKMATLLGWTQMEGVLPVLVELSKDPEEKVRKAALFSLLTLYPEESEDRLLKAMRDSDPGLRKWAKKTLEKMIETPVLRKESVSARNL